MDMMRLNLIITATIVLVGFSSVAAQTGADPCADTKTKLTQAENRLKDWPQLGRYHDANSKLSPAPKNEARVVFMGDSITDSWQNPKFGGFFPGKPYVNRGISGQTTPQMLIRFRPDVIALQPRAVLILAGTNDIAGNTGQATLEMIEDNLTSIAELAKAHNIRVILASVLPIHDQGKTKMSERRPPDTIRALNAWIKKYAAENGHLYLDYYSRMIDDKGMLKA